MGCDRSRSERLADTRTLESLEDTAFCVVVPTSCPRPPSGGLGGMDRHTCSCWARHAVSSRRSRPKSSTLERKCPTSWLCSSCVSAMDFSCASFASRTAVFVFSSDCHWYFSVCTLDDGGGRVCNSEGGGGGDTAPLARRPPKKEDSTDAPPPKSYRD